MNIRIIILVFLIVFAISTAIQIDRSNEISSGSFPEFDSLMADQQFHKETNESNEKKSNPELSEENKVADYYRDHEKRAPKSKGYFFKLPVIRLG